MKKKATPATTNPVGEPKVVIKDDDQFKRFERFTEALVAVPKREIEETDQGAQEGR